MKARKHNVKRIMVVTMFLAMFLSVLPSKIVAESMGSVNFKLEKNGNNVILKLNENDSNYDYYYQSTNLDDLYDIYSNSMPPYDSMDLEGWVKINGDIEIPRSMLEYVLVQVIKVNKTDQKIKAYQYAYELPLQYVQDGYGLMAYSYKYGRFDVFGKFNSLWKQTTYSTAGFETAIKINGGDAIDVRATGNLEPVSEVPGLNAGVNLSFYNKGSLVKVSYTIQNNTSSAITYDLGSGADVQIGSDDAAAITKILDDDSVSKGFKMVSATENDKNAQGEFAQFNFFGRNVSGVTNVSDYWYGEYYQSDAAFKEEKDCSTSENNYDSQMGYSWKNKTINVGETQTYAVYIGVGGAGSELLPGIIDVPTTIKDPSAPMANFGSTIEQLQEAVFTPEEKVIINNGVNASVYLEVKNIQDQVTPEDQRLAESFLGKNERGFYLDISLFKKVGTTDPQKVTNLNGKIKISIQIPNELLSKDKDDLRQFAIINVHDGVVKRIEGVYNKDTNEFVFETDCFSTYALVYTDKDATSPTTGENTTRACLWIALILVSSTYIYLGRRYKTIL